MSPRFKRKTTQDPAHGSFFLRVGAIGMHRTTLPYTAHCSTSLLCNFAILTFLQHPSFYSIWAWYHDLHWAGVWIVLRDTVHLSVPPDTARRQSSAADDLHLHADVLYLHERTGKHGVTRPWHRHQFSGT